MALRLLVAIVPLVKSGKLRALAVTSLRRAPEYPDLPAIEETYAGFEATIWLGLFAPAGTPQAVLERLRYAVRKALSAADVQSRLVDVGGLRPLALPPADFARLIRRDHARYGEIVGRIGVRIN